MTGRKFCCSFLFFFPNYAGYKEHLFYCFTKSPFLQFLTAPIIRCCEMADTKWNIWFELLLPLCNNRNHRVRLHTGPQHGWIHSNIQRKEEPQTDEEEEGTFPCQHRIWFVLTLLEKCVSCLKKSYRDGFLLSNFPPAARPPSVVFLWTVYMCLCVQGLQNSLCMSVFVCLQCSTF